MTSHKEVAKLYKSRFFLLFAGRIQIRIRTNIYRAGSRRPKNQRILQIRIRATGQNWTSLSIILYVIWFLFSPCTVPKIRFMYSQKGYCVALFPIPTFMYLWAIYIFPELVCLFGSSKIGRRILGIYKSLTDTWIWNLKDRTCSARDWDGKDYLRIIPRVVW